MSNERVAFVCFWVFWGFLIFLGFRGFPVRREREEKLIEIQGLAHGGEVSRSSGASIRGIGLTFRGLGAGKVCRLSGVSLRSTMCCEGHRFDVVSLGASSSS